MIGFPCIYAASSRHNATLQLFCGIYESTEKIISCQS